MFQDYPDYNERVDFDIFNEGSIRLYQDFRNFDSSYQQEMAADVKWLEDHGYRVHTFDCARWRSFADFRADIIESLKLTGFWGDRLDAFDDGLRSAYIPQNGGLVLLLLHYDAFFDRLPYHAPEILDVIADNSRKQLLVGKRLLAHHGNIDGCSLNL